MHLISVLTLLMLVGRLSTMVHSSDLQFFQKTKYTMGHRWQQLAADDDMWSGQLPYETNGLDGATDEMRLNDALLLPNNPVPMMQPNPFANSMGGQILFNGKRNQLRRMEGAFCRRSFDGRSGYCILANQCLHVVREYRVHGTKIDVCTYRRNIPVICCPLADKHVELQRISAQKCQEYHRETLGNINVGVPRQFSGKLCVPSVPMIVGGEIVRHSLEYPHMAALGWSQPNGINIIWDCGGTLISRRFVLSAAHCAMSVEQPPDVVRLGAVRLNETAVHQLDIKILIIILHPKYQSTSYYHDIALLKLARVVQFSPQVRPACLWQLPSLDIPVAIATGWGHTEFMGSKSENLRKVDLQLIDQQQCKRLYKTERRLPYGIIDEQFCAGHLAGGKDTCQGDSGGPLHAELPEYNCIKFIVGVTSFGRFCATPNAPGIYTKISAYLDWIEKIVFRDELI